MKKEELKEINDIINKRIKRLSEYNIPHFAIKKYRTKRITWDKYIKLEIYRQTSKNRVTLESSSYYFYI